MCIVTNAHVARGAVKVRVLFGSLANGRPNAPLEAQIVGIDRESDLALIKGEPKRTADARE